MALGLGLGIGLSGRAGAAASAPLIPLATPLTVIGDSMTYGDFRAKSYLYWLNLALSGRLFIPQTTNSGTSSTAGAQCGVSGDTSAQIAARIATCNTHNGVYIILLGQNDGAGVTAGDQQTNFTTIFTELQDALKIYVIPFAETVSVAASSTLQTRNTTNKAWLADYGGNVTLLPDSVWDGIALHDGAGGAGAQSFDGTHPNVNGVWRLANNIATEILPEIMTGDVYDVITELGFATNLFAADFSGTGGSVGSGSTGQVATGLALTTTGTTGLTVTASKGTLDGDTSQIITITGTASTGTVQVQLRETATHTFDINDGFFIGGKIKVTASDGTSAPVGLQAVGYEAAGGRHAYLSRFSPNNENGALFAFEGMFVGTPEVNGAGGSSINIDLGVRFVPSATVDVRIEVANVKVFNQTQELAA